MEKIAIVNGTIKSDAKALDFLCVPIYAEVYKDHELLRLGPVKLPSVKVGPFDFSKMIGIDKINVVDATETLNFQEFEPIKETQLTFEISRYLATASTIIVLLYINFQFLKCKPFFTSITIVSLIALQAAIIISFTYLQIRISRLEITTKNKVLDMIVFNKLGVKIEMGTTNGPLIYCLLAAILSSLLLIGVEAIDYFHALKEKKNDKPLVEMAPL